MSSYADTGFLLSLYVFDGNSNLAAAQIKQANLPLPLTPFGEFELTNAVSLRLFRREIPAAEAKDVRASILQDIQGGILLRRPLEAVVYEKAAEIARRRTPHLGTRALDVLHVASALVLGCRRFHTFDDNQRLLARSEGLLVR